MKDYTEEQKVEICGLLDEYSNIQFLNPRRKETLEQFKKDKGLLPEPTLKVGKWNRYPNESILIFVTDIQNDQGVGYGFNHLGDWIDDYTIGAANKSSMYPATDQEVETALIAEATKRGFSEFKNKLVLTILKHDNPHHTDWYQAGTNNTYRLCGNLLKLGAFTICDNGKWATIIEPKSDVQIQVDKLQAEIDELKKLI